ncbi:glycosyltransferase family A protein [Aliihoeflea sp. 2WW]|uniref:glycosyltransferase family 2 protein n=1 Tax=Aliihoeflea sp. 2WW TaxID=1381123 RepID=UPI0004AF84A0|nr:glycosyltransferase family A protein [Aliihoeflea sp. 2WW]
MTEVLRKWLWELRRFGRRLRASTALNQILAGPATRAIREADIEARNRNFRKSIALLEALPDTSVTLERRAFNYLQARDFEGVLRIHARSIELGCCTKKLRRINLEALANLDSKRTGEQSVEEIAGSHDDIDQLAYLFRYVRRCSPERVSEFSNSLIEHPDYRALTLVQKVMLAHDCLERGEIEKATQLQNDLRERDVRVAGSAVDLQLLASQLQFKHGNYGGQVAAINLALLAQGLSSVALIDVGSPFAANNIRGEVGPATGALLNSVSVIMTARNSSATIAYAIESILRQTHRNLELIIIDDDSEDLTVATAQRAIGSDERAKIVSLPKNVGTYAARNVALLHAKGEFVTCQDSDDWAHPQKLEKLTASLAKSCDKIGAFSHHVRCSAVHGMHNRNGHYTRRDISSLLYRREKVVQAIGYYDEVRAGADGEHQFRLERTFGSESLIDMPLTLNFVALSETSLTGGGPFSIDDNTGSFSPLRNEYRRSYCAWHESASNLYLPHAPKNRAFPVPAELLP